MRPLSPWEIPSQCLGAQKDNRPTASTDLLSHFLFSKILWAMGLERSSSWKDCSVRPVWSVSFGPSGLVCFVGSVLFGLFRWFYFIRSVLFGPFFSFLFACFVWSILFEPSCLGCSVCFILIGLFYLVCSVQYALVQSVLLWSVCFVRSVLVGSFCPSCLVPNPKQIAFLLFSSS